jgi:hypothetical protein
MGWTSNTQRIDEKCIKCGQKTLRNDVAWETYVWMGG